MKGKSRVSREVLLFTAYPSEFVDGKNTSFSMEIFKICRRSKGPVIKSLTESSRIEKSVRYGRPAYDSAPPMTVTVYYLTVGSNITYPLKCIGACAIDLEARRESCRWSGEYRVRGALYLSGPDRGPARCDTNRDRIFAETVRPNDYGFA